MKTFFTYREEKSARVAHVFRKTPCFLATLSPSSRDTVIEGKRASYSPSTRDLQALDDHLTSCLRSVLFFHVSVCVLSIIRLTCHSALRLKVTVRHHYSRDAVKAAVMKAEVKVKSTNAGEKCKERESDTRKVRCLEHSRGERGEEENNCETTYFTAAFVEKC